MTRDESYQWMLEHLEAAISERLADVEESDFAKVLGLSSPSATVINEAAKAALERLLKGDAST